MKIDNFDSENVKDVDAMQSVVTAFESIVEAIVNKNTIKQKQVDSALFAEESAKGFVYQSKLELIHELYTIAQVQAARALVNKLPAIMLSKYDVVANYPVLIDRMLKGDAPDFIILKLQVKGKEVWLLVDRITWNNYWNDHFTGDEIDVGDLPF